MTDPRVVVVAGARPNFMKVAPVLAALEAAPAVPSLLVHTGQHYDEKMSRLFFDELEIRRPDVNLGVNGGSPASQIARVIEGIEPVLAEHRPDLVVVVGDVNATLAASLAAAKTGVAIAHVEAGLRSFDRTMPEEINRVLTDAVSELLFVTEESGVQNLRCEGVAEERIHLVGNAMIDTLRKHQERARSRPILEELGLDPRGYAVLTLHRPSNVDDPARLARVLGPVLELAGSLPVVFPVHPRTRSSLDRISGATLDAKGLRLLEPLGYLDFVRLLTDARLVLTDSGGIQEETTILGVPCITLRESTERPITIRHGTNRLAGTTPDGIRRAIADAMRSPTPTSLEPPPLWDGNAGFRIGRILRDWLPS